MKNVRSRPRGPVRAAPDSLFIALRGFLNIPRWLVVSLGLAGVLVIGAFDWVTGPDLDPSLLYVLAVLGVAFHSSSRDGLAMAVVATATGVAARFDLHGQHPMTAGSLVWNLSTRVAAFIFLVLVISALRRTIDALERMASYDQLTGALNRPALTDAIERERARAARDDRPMTVVFFDLDDLKTINNRLGHEEGDRLLESFAARVQGTIRPYDLFGRVGGDEFVLVLPETGEREAYAALSRLHRAIGAGRGPDDPPVAVSAGVATFVTVPDSVREMINEADALMYRAKAAGGRRMVGELVAGPFGRGDELLRLALDLEHIGGWATRPR